MKNQLENRRGAMLVLVAVVMVILLVGAVYSVDVAYMHMVRAELRSATDAAARAGSEALLRTQDASTARAAAMEIAERNQVAGDGLTLSNNDVEIGNVRQNGRRLEFVPGGRPFNAVRITGRRTEDASDGAVGLFFAKFFSATRFQPIHSATASANVRDIALVLDVSGSMEERSGGTTRLRALQEAVHVFLDEVTQTSPDLRISLITYSTWPEKVLELTDDFEAIRDEVENFEAQGWTAIGNGLLMGSDSLLRDPQNRSHALKTIIIMTDGNHNVGPSPATTVQTAVSHNQQVHTITFSNGANQRLMQQVAQATEGGMHIHANGAGDLSQAFRTIARSLSVTIID